MDLKTALTKLEGMLTLMGVSRQQFTREKSDELISLYGEVEDIIHQFEGIQSIIVDNLGSQRLVFKDYIAAGWLSGSTVYSSQGRTQLVKLIAKVRRHIADPGRAESPASVDQLLRTLQRFRECCQFIRTPPADEKDVQDIVWIMLRAQFDRVDRENVLPRFGAKTYRPDYGVPELRTFIEVKFIGQKTDLGKIQEEIIADVPGYLSSSSEYAGIIVLVYDAAQKLRDPRKFIDDLRLVEGITEVIVVPGIGAPG